MGAPMVGLRHGLGISFRCPWLTLAPTSRGEDANTPTGLIPRRCRVERRQMGAPIVGLRHGPGVSFRCPWLTLAPTYLSEDVRNLTMRTRLATPLPRRVPVNGRSHDRPSAQHGARLQMPLIELRLGRSAGLGSLGTRDANRTDPRSTRTDPNLHNLIQATNRPELTRFSTKWFGQRTDPKWPRTDLNFLFNRRNRYRAPPIARLFTSDQHNQNPGPLDTTMAGDPRGGRGLRYRWERPPLWWHRPDPDKIGRHEPEGRGTEVVTRTTWRPVLRTNCTPQRKYRR